MCHQADRGALTSSESSRASVGERSHVLESDHDAVLHGVASAWIRATNSELAIQAIRGPIGPDSILMNLNGVRGRTHFGSTGLSDMESERGSRLAILSL